MAEKIIKLTRKQLEDEALVKGLQADGWTCVLRGSEQKEPKKYVPYTNNKGETTLVTEAQAAMYEANKDPEKAADWERKCKEHNDKKAAFVPTPEMDAWIVAHPNVSKNEMKEQFPEWLGDRKFLAQRKRDLKVR